MRLFRRWRGWGVLVMVPALLVGCGEFAYKRGAGQSDLEQAHAACREAGAARTDYKKCMENRGWTVSDMDDMTPLAATSVTADNRSATNPSGANGNSKKSDAPKAQISHAPELIQQSGSSNATEYLIVDSMWKFGGTGAGLDTDIALCVSRLGDAHRPRFTGSQRLMTRGLLFCLRENGWYGISNR